METKAPEAPTNRVYEVFEPYCKWKTEEGQDILDIDLKGFKKEQLRVQTNDKGMLIISGEKPLDATKWTRFRKETKLSRDCNLKGIRAKFSLGVLSIVIPKRVQVPPLENVVKNEADVQGTKLEAQKKDVVWGVKIDKGRILKVAVVVAAVVIVVAIARLAHVYRHPLDAAKEDVVVM